MIKLSLNKEIIEFLKQCGIDDDDTLGKFDLYRRFLFEENRKYNLTSIKDEEGFWIRHICDSASIFRENRNCFSSGKKICDIGSGAGFPAIIIAMCSESYVYSIESSRKKADFIRKIAELIGIKNITVFNCRAEEMNKKLEFYGFFDIITARAVSKVSNIIKHSIKMLGRDSQYILYKTPFSAETEVKEAQTKFKNMFFTYQEKFCLPLNMGTRLFVIAKRVKNEK
ncbi:MAG TPA: 16S rRNA (guanine(527)-N(7))-methyltransferase RsmG [Victivallales bacterium]|nr:16S rRNA (guanine(527)-N(7))-methyltransferase RsmG [Victivallales bacterium]HRR06708.1 16S rRNA (guanine(527)-N(7))-methyltransferase RsmG [Victivallales bacterium]HRR28255.1 16S rRNA (guanine(527)-N(7))-methyltransferase RsmG [Victivallales bacterium]HRU00127.1 16S rRNA (guanine(527)-N(7))-methyltransferase RsmG [Victivallales bacterium]